jgi:hypothetical protein
VSTVQKRTTVRAVGLGLGLVLILDLWVIYAEYILRSSRLNVSHHFPVSVVALFVIVILVNGVWRRVSSGGGLTQMELYTILAMCLAGIVIPSNGLTSYLLGSLSAPYYFATPENGWDMFHPYLPGWIAPTNQTALRWFFEGLPSGVSTPWHAWSGPLTWWALLGSAFVLVSFCVATAFRRQWVEHERLVYPMLIPAQELTRLDETSSFLPPFARSRIFWAGFAIAFGFLGWNVVCFFNSSLPRLPIQGHWFAIARGFPNTFYTRVNFFTIGFAYFANVEVLLSVWVFFAIMNLEMLITDRIGYTISLGGGASLPNEANPMITWQTTGAYLVYVGWAVWTARAHLKSVFLKAFGRDAVDDEREMISYRKAVIGAVCGSVFIVSWLHAAGMEVLVAAVLLLVLFASYLGAAKIVAEMGLPYSPATLGAEGFVVAAVGTTNMAEPSIAVLAFSQNMSCYGKGMVLPPITQITRIGDQLRGSAGWLAVAVCSAFAVSYVISTVFTLWLGYTRGAYNFSAYPFTYYSRRIFDWVVYRMSHLWQIDPHRLMFMGAGMVIMSILTFLRYRFSWWRLNPMGFALPRLTWQVYSLFLAWVAKTLIFQLGGVQFYRKTQPFFIGLIVGYSLAVGLGSVVDWIWFPGRGHGLHSW